MVTVHANVSLWSLFNTFSIFQYNVYPRNKIWKMFPICLRWGMVHHLDNVISVVGSTFYIGRVGKYGNFAPKKVLYQILLILEFPKKEYVVTNKILRKYVMSGIVW